MAPNARNRVHLTATRVQINTQTSVRRKERRFLHPLHQAIAMFIKAKQYTALIWSLATVNTKCQTHQGLHWGDCQLNSSLKPKIPLEFALLLMMDLLVNRKHSHCTANCTAIDTI
jgi:hypothetical protein